MEDQQNTDKPTKAEEAAGIYRTWPAKRLVVSSPEEQEQHMYAYWLSLTPEQRLN